MEAITVLSETVGKNGVIVLTARYDYMLRVLGSSLPTSFSGQQGRILPTATHTFSMCVRQGDAGVVVLGVEMPDKKTMRCLNFFIPVAWDKDEEKPRVNLKDPWVPPNPDRLLKASTSHVEIVYGGVRFTNRQDSEKKQGEVKVRYVPDGDMICKYANGDIEADELKAAAVEYEEEVSAREQVLELKQHIESVWSAVDLANDLLASKNQQLAKQWSQLSEAQRHLQLWQTKRKRMELEVEKRYFFTPWETWAEKRFLDETSGFCTWNVDLNN